MIWAHRNADAESLNAPCTNARWRSRSMSTQSLQDLIGTLRFRDEYLQLRNIGVPLDERGNAAESRDRECVKIPHCIAHRTRVGIDQDRAIAVRIHAVTGEVNLAHVTRIDMRDVLPCIEAVIATTDIDVVDVQQQSAAAAIGQRLQKLPFGHLRVRKLQ